MSDIDCMVCGEGDFDSYERALLHRVSEHLDDVTITRDGLSFQTDSTEFRDALIEESIRKSESSDGD